MRFGKTENRRSAKLLKFVSASLIFCACAISAACQNADERFDATLKQCVETNHKNLDDGTACLEKTLRSNPDRAVVYLFLADNYRQLNEIEKAERAIENYVRAYPLDAAGRESFCRILAEKGDFTNAMAECARAIQNAPKDISIRLTAASVQEKMGKPEDAERTYKDALDINPKDSAALLYLGRLYEKTGDLDRAVETYEKLIERKPDNYQKIEEGVKRLKAQRELKSKNPPEIKKDVQIP